MAGLVWSFPERSFSFEPTIGSHENVEGEKKCNGVECLHDLLQTT